MRNLYFQISNHEIQRSHPFGHAEERFNWINGCCDGNDLKTPTRPRKIIRDNLEGGIGRFLLRNQMLNEKEGLNNNNNNCYKHPRRNLNKFININTERVLDPEKNTEKEIVNKKKTYIGEEKNLRHETGGRITSLFDKTPLEFNYRGKKTFYNNSMDYGYKNRSKALNLFDDSNNYQENKRTLRKMCKKSYERDFVTGCIDTEKNYYENRNPYNNYYNNSMDVYDNNYEGKRIHRSYRNKSTIY